VTPTTFSVRRAALVADDTLQGEAFGEAYAALVDEWLAQLLGDETGIALLAGGALGRRALAPGSDLDLVLLHEARRDGRAVAERLWYPIWDAGIALDHSVRTPREAVAVADEDLKVVLSLLDGRVVAGDEDLGANALATIRKRWVTAAPTRLPGLDAITRDRHRRHGEAAHLLEPDLKQARGGLRDLTVLHALDVATPACDAATTAVDRAGATLLAVRITLHRTTGRPTDRLSLQEQDAVAARAGLPDADVLMHDVAAAATTIARAGDDAWRRTRSWLAGPRRRSAAGGERALGRGLVLRDGEVDLAVDAELDDPTLLLRATERAASFDTTFRRGVLERLADQAALPTAPWPPEARNALVGLLGAGLGLVPVADALDEQGLMIRLLPEWETVRSRPQRNALHRYTVDRHLLEATVEASRLTRRVGRPDLLLVGAWLHDLGKGARGDHTEVGVALMGRIGPRLGFPDADVEILRALVREHLLLPSIATSRDLDDPLTVELVAERVGDVTTLELLAALSEADSRATGDGVWNTFKANLVASLVARVRRALEGEAVPPLSGAAPAEHTALAQRAAGSLLVEGRNGRLVIAAPDRPGLLARVVGLLAIHAQSVRSALVSTIGDTAVEEFNVEPLFGRHADWMTFASELDDAIEGRFPLDARIAERAREYGVRGPKSSEPVDARVLVHPEASTTDTVLEVRAADGVGVLYRLTQTLASEGLDVRQARANTLGQEVVDTFYVRENHGMKLDDAAIIRVERALLASLAE
jgi:[protein-PII] uridylyltransferase